MYCPKCGQQQVSDEMRFCPRCGFQLGAVIALMAGGGLPVAMSGAHLQSEKPSARKRGIRQGAKLMFVSGVLLPIALFLSIVTETPLPFVIPFTIFLAGLALNLYSRLFAEETGALSQSTMPAQFGPMQQGYLPAHQSIPAPGANKPNASTSEMARPPSVTEHTTKLLDEK